MPKIKIGELPRLQQISEEDQKKIKAGPTFKYPSIPLFWEVKFM